ncbi:Putative F-box domain-containing protein [Septoria linicola]|uniref:F-box domain-containing protein n=1 Tax=Septoria linicola TaxID=215465 RepID=A0A9Q9AJB4_9PEZI|nr:Putative F-box domain-containing protein [Septoria linicola]
MDAAALALQTALIDWMTDRRDKKKKKTTCALQNPSALDEVLATPELLAAVLSHLGARDILRSRLVCRNWNHQNRSFPLLRSYTNRFQFINLRSQPNLTIEEYSIRHNEAILHPVLRKCMVPGLSTRYPHSAAFLSVDALYTWKRAIEYAGQKQICQLYTPGMRCSIRQDRKPSISWHHTRPDGRGLTLNDLLKTALSPIFETSSCPTYVVLWCYMPE